MLVARAAASVLLRAQLPVVQQLAAVTQAASFSTTAGSSSSSSQQSSSWSSGAAPWGRAALAAGAAGGVVAATSGVALADAPAPTPAAAAALQPPADPYALPAPRGLPRAITLYQYEVCPFCCKVRAFLDYHQLPYTAVEVNPLTKGELRAVADAAAAAAAAAAGSSGSGSGSGSGAKAYRKVPVVVLNGGEEVVVDSSAIISRLAAELGGKRGGSGGSSGGGGWFGGKRGGGGVAAADDDDEERRWRRWVDERFVKVLTANIYRSWDESWATFDYMTQQSHWNYATVQAVRLAGAVLMWQVGRRMPAKYGIEGDLRAALYADADAFVGALDGRDFMGGSRPNLADLALYGVLTAVKGTATYNDAVVHSRIGPWLARVALAVGESAEVKQQQQ